jgi:small subunit ribosomal protein S9
MAETIKKGFISGTGRRKTATARVFIWNEKGDITVNGKDIETYFPDEKDQIKWLKPFHLIGVSHPKAKFTVSIKVSGSGQSGQVGAIVHGISRALAEMDPEYHTILAKQGLMTRDPRMVERKKPFLHKARKAPQYSKR